VREVTKEKVDLALAVALVPVLGTGLVLVNQLGRYFYYGVPPEMLELDAYKVLVSSLSMFFIGSTLLYVGASFYDSRGSRTWHRLGFHLLFAAILTAPFWLKEVGRSLTSAWLALLFVAFTAAVMFGVERRFKRGATDTSDQLSGWSLVAFFSSLLILIATCAHGYLSERDRTSYTFVESSNDAVVGRLGDLLILKTYDPTHRTFERDRTVLVSVERSLVLETRAMPQ
jgi:hypothetical protein